MPSKPYTHVSQEARQEWLRHVQEQGHDCPLCALGLHIDVEFTDTGYVEGEPMEVDVRITDEGGQLHVEVSEPRSLPASRLSMAGPGLGQQGPGGE